jgi:hypothetical protein
LPYEHAAELEEAEEDGLVFGLGRSFDDAIQSQQERSAMALRGAAPSWPGPSQPIPII